MALNVPDPGLNSVGEWSASPSPWMTASLVPAGGVVILNMPNVASRFTLNNVSGSSGLRFGFTYYGVTLNNNYMTVSPGGSFNEVLRFKNIYLYAPSGPVGFEFLAGITGIPVKYMADLTGSSGLTGVG